MTKQTDVLIIGGGFAGVAAAQKLAENGVDMTPVSYTHLTLPTIYSV